MKSNEYIEKRRRLIWLKGILKDYKGYIEVMEKAGDGLTVELIRYSFCGPGTPMNINPHRPIKAQYIHDALLDAVHELEIEIGGLENELKVVVVELEPDLEFA